ncbi:hypothetical protein C8F01DRAFT_1370137 [Mycena amicta]|nr:hypothetical protein C8F01DRAFT_1370137 [Mycena amicta]
MHRALAILEIVHAIVEHVDDHAGAHPAGDSDAESDCESEDSDFASETADSETLLALATTCKTFQDPALDALWREQTTLDNLVKCFPSELWKEEEKDSEQPTWECAGGSPGDMVVKMVGSTWNLQIPRDSWERTRWYSRRVRTLSISQDTHPSYSVLCAFRTALRDDGTCFPNLRTLRWTAEDEARRGYNFISDFHGPQLRNRVVFRTTRCHSPVAATSLISLAVDGLDLESLAHLSGLPNLRDLTLSSPSLTDLQPHVSQGRFDLVKTFAPWDRYTFSALHALTIHNAPLQYTVDLLNLPLEARQLQAIDVRTTEAMHKAKLALLYTAIGTHLPSTTMRKIVVRDKPDLEDRNLASPTPIADYRVDGQLVAPLFALKQVTSVELRCPNGFALDDGILRDLAQAWPGLEDLALLPCRKDVSDGGHLTLESLQILAEHCKRLHRLAIIITATSSPPLQLPDEGSIRQHALKTLDVGASALTVSPPSKVAQYLCSVFPSLHKLESQFVSWSAAETGRLEPAEVHSHNWREVDELVPMLSAARRNERAWADRERRVGLGRLDG